MSDDVFRQSRRKISAEEAAAAPTPGPEGDPLSEVRKMQQAISKETGREPPTVANPLADSPFVISGAVPPELREALANRSMGAPTLKPVPPREDEGFETFEAPPERSRPKPKMKATPDSKIRTVGSDQLEGLLRQLAEKHQWETFELPSRAKFYDDIPATIHLRPMTGEEEQILATPRWVRRGKAIDMIFQRCIRENFATEGLLSVDRTHLLIYLRGISYTPEYDVEVRCPACGTKFSTVINLNDLNVEFCPEDFDPAKLEGTLPTSGFHYRYRLSTGADEQEISNYREKRIQQWGDQSEDDTLLYRTALLLEEIEGVTMKKELAMLLKRLPINDVSFLRNEINDPPFGVDTKVPMMCPSCSEEFEIDLPLETNFFFPRKKETKTPA